MGLQVGTVQHKYREDFSAVDSLAGWDIKLGPGMSLDLSQASGMRLLTGTTVNSVSTLRYTNLSFETPVRAIFYALGTALLSQRIANQEFELRLVSEDGTEFVSWLLDGTVTTTGKVKSANRGVGNTDTSATIPDSATGSAALELESWIDETYWHTRAADNANARTGSYVRNRRIPDPSTKMFVEIVARNLSTAPASTTTLALDAITVQDISEMTAEITGGRGGGSASQAVPVSVLSSVGITLNSLPAVNTGAVDWTHTTAALGAGATFTQSTNVDLGTDVPRRPNRSRIEFQGTAAAQGSIANLVLQESPDGTTYREVWRCPMPNDGAMHTFELPLRQRYRRWIINNGATAQTALFLQERLLNSDGATDIDKNLPIPLTPVAGTALGIGAVFTGPTLDLGGNHAWDKLRYVVRSDQALAAGGLVFQQSPDGTNWHTVLSTTVGAGGVLLGAMDIAERYSRILATQGATAGTALFVGTSLVSL